MEFMEYMPIYHMAVIPFEDATFLFTIAFITMAVGTLGLLTKYKIFLLFAIGGMITMIPEFAEYPAIVVTLIGIIIFNLWYATLGGNY